MKSMPRILLLTDLPPCENFTAGIVTAQICRAMPRDQLSLFCVLNQYLKPELCEDLRWIPSRTVAKPPEMGRRSIRSIASFANSLGAARSAVPSIRPNGRVSRRNARCCGESVWMPEPDEAPEGSAITRFQT